MKILYIADIIGKVGVWAVKKNIEQIKQRYQPDFIIAHTDGTTGAGGLGKQHAGYLKKLGIQCLVGGALIFQKQDLVAALPQFPFVLRPFNLPAASPGIGYRCFVTSKKEKIAVVSLLGRIGQRRMLADNPFTAVQSLLPELHKQAVHIVVDFSSLATAEKQAMGFFLAGKTSAVIGSGTGAASADYRLLTALSKQEDPTAADTSNTLFDLQQDRMTAFITDAGRTGSFDSVGGYDPKGKIQEYRNGLFEYPQEIRQRVCVQGLVIECDEAGSAVSIERVCVESASS